MAWFCQLGTWNRPRYPVKNSRSFHSAINEVTPCNVCELRLSEGGSETNFRSPKNLVCFVMATKANCQCVGHCGNLMVALHGRLNCRETKRGFLTAAD